MNRIPTLWKVLVDPVTLEWLSAERLTTGAAGADSAANSPDATRLAFTSHRGGTRGWVFPFDAATGRLQGAGRPVTEDDATISSLSLARDGRSVLYLRQRKGTDSIDMLATDLESGTTSVLARNAYSPAASRDGTRVGYLLSRPQGSRDAAASSEAVAPEYALAVRDRTGAERLMSRWTSRAAMLVTDWTPDGTAMLGSYWEPLNTGPVVMALWPASDAVADRPETVLLQAPGQRFWQATFSPNGHWISFVAQRADEPDRLQMGVVPAEGTRTDGWTRIAADHVWPDKPRWAPDGQTLYFLSQSRSASSTSGACAWTRPTGSQSATRSRSPISNPPN